MSFRGIFKPWDITVLLVIVLVTHLWMSGEKKPGTEAEALRVVWAQGEDTLSLGTDTVIQRGSVVIEIASGQAAIISSDCHSQICVKTGWLDSPGEISACMPNETFIQITGSENTVDVISY